jgi:hypothetical protein
MNAVLTFIGRSGREHQCKHQRKYFLQSEAAKSVSDSEPLIKRGGFKPFDQMPSEEKAPWEIINVHIF